MSSYIPMKKWDEDYLRELKAVYLNAESRERERFDSIECIYGEPFTDGDISVFRFSHQIVAPIWESCLFVLKNDLASFLYDYDEVSLPNYPLTDIFNYISQLTLLGKYRLAHYFFCADDKISLELTDAIFNNDSIRFQQIANENDIDIKDFRKRITSAIVLGEELASVYSYIEDEVNEILSFDAWDYADVVIKDLDRSVERFPKANSRIIKKIQTYLKKQLREYDYDVFDEMFPKLTGLNITGASGFLFLFLSYTFSLFLLLIPKMERKGVNAIKDFFYKPEAKPIFNGIARLLYIISKDDCQSESVFQPEYFHHTTANGPFVDYLESVGLEYLLLTYGLTREQRERLNIAFGREQEEQNQSAPLPADQDSPGDGKLEEQKETEEMNVGDTEPVDENKDERKLPRRELKPMVFPKSSRGGRPTEHWLINRYATIPGIDDKVAKLLKAKVWPSLIKEVRTLTFPLSLNDRSRTVLCASLVFHAAELSGIANVETIKKEQRGSQYDGTKNTEELFDARDDSQQERDRLDGILMGQNLSIREGGVGLSEEGPTKRWARFLPSSYRDTLRLMNIKVSQGGPMNYLRMLNYWLPEYNELLMKKSKANEESKRLSFEGKILLHLNACKKEIKSLKELMEGNREDLSNILNKLEEELPSYFDSIK